VELERPIEELWPVALKQSPADFGVAVPAISLPFAFRYIEKTALNANCCRESNWVYVCVPIRLAHASTKNKGLAIRSAIRLLILHHAS